MATERIQIIVTSKGTVTVRKEITDIGTASKAAHSNVGLLQGALTAIVSGAAIANIVRYGDSFTRLQNSLKVAGLEGVGLQQVQDRLFEQANRNGVEVESLAQVYNRMSLAQAELGATSNDILTVTSGVAASLKLMGTTGEQARGPMLQLSQALGNGIVRAEEWNSITEGMLPVAQAAARGMDGMGGSVAKLRMAILAVEVTSKEFFDALKVGFIQTEKQAMSAQLTVGQSLTVLNNEMTRFIGSLLNSRGVMSLLSDAIIWLAFNLNTVLVVLTPLIAALTVLAGAWVVSAFTNAAAAIGSMATALSRLLLLLLANPVVLFAAAIAGVILYFLDWEQAINNVYKAWLIFRYEWEKFWDGNASQKTIELILNAEQAIADLKNNINTMKAALTEGAKSLGGGVKAGSQSGAEDLKNGVKAGAQDAAAMLANAQNAAVARFEAMNGKAVQQLGATLTQGGNYMYNQVTGAVETAAPALDAATTAGGKTAGETIEQHMTSGGQRAGAMIYDSVESAFASIAPLWDVIDAFYRREGVELRKLQSETGKNIAEMRKLRAEADAVKMASRYGDRSGGGGGSGGGSGGGGGGSETIVYDIAAYRESQRMEREAAAQKRNGPVAAGSGGASGVNLTNVNVVDPQAALMSLETQKGNKTVVNVIANNREEIQRILGVY